MAILLPHDAVVAKLRGSGIPKLDWNAGPWLDEAAEPQPDFPFLVYIVTPTELQLTFEKPFIAVYEIEFALHALQPDIAVLISEYGDPAASVFAFLDKSMATPGDFSEAGVFTCFQWIRQLPVDVKKSEFRTPKSPRAWKGSAKYTMSVTADAN